MSDLDVRYSEVEIKRGYRTHHTEGGGESRSVPERTQAELGLSVLCTNSCTAQTVISIVPRPTASPSFDGLRQPVSRASFSVSREVFIPSIRQPVFKWKHVARDELSAARATALCAFAPAVPALRLLAAAMRNPWLNPACPAIHAAHDAA